MYVEILAEVVDGSSILGIIGRREVLTASEPETPKHVLGGSFPGAYGSMFGVERHLMDSAGSLGVLL